MGTCCCGNQPSEKFVGKWSNGLSETLIINSDGHIYYNKTDGISKTNYTNCPARFDENSFRFCCCICCSLNGAFDQVATSQPTLIIDGKTFTKQPK